jgi:predicted CopG family antitoxin
MVLSRGPTYNHYRKDHHMALSMHSPGTQRAEHGEDSRLYHTITIDNENDGRRTTIVASAGERFSDVIEELYQRLGRERFDGDRLCWESDGEDVASFAELTLEEYFEFGHCPRLRWVFVGATGGDCVPRLPEVAATRLGA